MAGTAAKPTTGNGGWEVVRAESALNLRWENPGDEFIGTYVGVNTVTPPASSNVAPFDQYIFLDESGQKIAVSQTATVRDGITNGNVKQGDMVKLTYVQDIDTGQESPMKDITVAVKRS